MLNGEYGIMLIAAGRAGMFNPEPQASGMFFPRVTPP